MIDGIKSYLPVPSYSLQITHVIVKENDYRRGSIEVEDYILSQQL